MGSRTKSLGIPKSVRERVWARDGGLCVICGRPGAPNAHYIGRAQGGLGIEENILTLCADCHRLYDQTAHRERLREYLTDYLRGKYDGWDDIRLTYQKEDKNP